MAGATAADLRGILALPENAAPGPSQSKKASTKKPEGIPRELYALIGPSAPTMVAQPAKPRFKQKPNLGGGGSVRWCVALSRRGVRLA
jgi:DNA methyltransferase 1-associated protein 1